MTKIRLPPLAPSDWSDEVRALLGGMLDGDGRIAERKPGDEVRPIHILTTIAYQPHLLGPFLGFAAALATRGALPRRDSELLALRTAWNCHSDFEWGHHVVYARAEGLSETQIDAIARGPSDADFGPRDRLLLDAADELHRDQRIADATWAALQAELDEAQLVEIPFVVGNYTMLSMLANSAGVPLEEGLSGLPEG